MADNANVYPFQLGAGENAGTPDAGWIGGGAAPGGNSNAAIGQYAGAAPGNSEYWLPIWSGEILRAYDQYNIFEPLVTTKTIASGTTMRFPITGTVGIKSQWKAGEELLGSTDAVAPSYFDISLDSRPMASHFELDDISLLLTQWEYRSELARQAGLALATTRDKQIACLIAQAAFMAPRSPAVAKGGSMYNALAAEARQTAGGSLQFADYTDAAKYDLPASAVFNALGNTTATAAGARADAALLLLEYIERYMVRLQEMDGPTEGVYVAVTPQAFQDIRALGIARAAGDAKNMQPMFGGVAEAGGLGAPYTVGMNNLADSLEYMGATIIKTNHMLDQTVFNTETSTEQAWISANTPVDVDGDIDAQLHNVVFDASGTGNVGGQDIGTSTDGTVANVSAPTAQGKQLIRITDLGDSKYDFDWLNYGDGSGATPTAGATRMNPVKALIWQKDAVASLNLQGMKVDTVQDVRRNSQFTVASKMSGGGILRPELCAAILGHGVI